VFPDVAHKDIIITERITSYFGILSVFNFRSGKKLEPIVVKEGMGLYRLEGNEIYFFYDLARKV
jgi:hypothetical protein